MSSAIDYPGGSLVPPGADHCSELRRAFDRSFAEPPQPAPSLVRLIAIRASGDALALPHAQLTGIHRRRRIVPVLSRNPALLGVSGLRGAVVPVFSLAAILEIPPSGRDPAWLALAMPDSPLALAFDELEGPIDLAPDCIHEDPTVGSRRHIHRLARVGSLVRGVVDIPSIVEAIRRKAGIPQDSRSKS